MADRRLKAVPPAEQSDERLTIEQLAHATGMTVRNIRNHQSRGLLPPPEVIARTGFYGPGHVERLHLIREMQAEGFNLEAIKRLLAGGDDQLMGFRRAITTPLESESPEIVTVGELADRFGALDPRTIAKAEKLEILMPLGDGRYEVPSPSLLKAAEEAVERGIAMPDALEAVERVKRHCESISRAFVRLFLEELWKPIRDSGDAEKRWSEVVEAIDALKPVSSQTVLALFNQTMTAEIESAFARELEKMSRGKGRR
jgi:DNA-binding transcriptional MerR regulator